MSKFSFSTTSSGEKLSSALDEVSKTVETELPKVYEAEQVREDDRFEISNNISDEATKLRESQRRIDQIEREIAALDERYKSLEDNEPEDGVTPEQIIAQKQQIRDEQMKLRDEKRSEMNNSADYVRKLEYLQDMLQRR